MVSLTMEGRGRSEQKEEECQFMDEKIAVGDERGSHKAVLLHWMRKFCAIRLRVNEAANPSMTFLRSLPRFRITITCRFVHDGDSFHEFTIQLFIRE
jgi:hypothetical protein